MGLPELDSHLTSADLACCTAAARGAGVRDSPGQMAKLIPGYPDTERE